MLASGLSSAAQWARTFGGSDSTEEARAVRATVDGGYVVAGSRTPAGGRSEAWVAKLDASGIIAWQKAFGGTTAHLARSLQATPDGGFIVAGQASTSTTQGDVWVAKLDGNGDVVWQRTYRYVGATGPSDAQSVQLTTDGGYVVAGIAYTTRSLGTAIPDAWILKLDAAGNVVWQRTYGGSDADYALSIEPLADGGYVVAGATFVAASFGASQSDAWLLKLDADGAVLWQRTYGTGGNEVARAVKRTVDGGYIVAGSSSTATGTTPWVLKVDAFGGVLWQRTYGGTGSGGAYAVQPTGDGGMLVSGAGAWALKLDPAGNVVWSRVYGNGDDVLVAIDGAPDGGYVLAGYAFTSRVLGSAVPDAWVLKLDPVGDIPGCSAVRTLTTAAASTSVAAVAGTATAASASVSVAGGSAAVADAGVASSQQCLFAGPGPATSFQGLWWNAPANSESGWGINLAHQDDVIFATWYTYDASGRDAWLSMTATRTADNVYSGTLYRTTGPPFDAVPFDPERVTRTAVGMATLTFTDVGVGSFAYRVGDVRQTKAITRQVFGPVPSCAWSAGNDLAAATNYQDLWWAAPGGTESGWGVNVAHQGDTIFATWFTYDADGRAMWLSATAPRNSAGEYAGTLYRSTGPAFDAAPFDPSAVTRNAVGSVRLAFRDGNAGSFGYTVALAGGSPVTESKPITRQVFRPPGTVCR
jgi:hypothetical protein